MYNILFVHTDLRGGGAERVMLNVMRGIDRAKFHPILFLIKNDGVYWNEVPDDVEIITALKADQRICWNLPRLLMKLFRISLRADILVGAMELTPTYFAILIGILLKRPVMGWVHVNLKNYLSVLSPVHVKLIQWTYPHLAAVVAVSEGAAKSIAELIPSLRGKIEIVHNPLLLDKICLLAQEPPDADLFGPIVLAAGRLTYQKGFDVLIRAHVKLLERGGKQRLVILGEGPARKELESLIHELGAQNSVSLPGFKTNPYAWMKRANIFVLSSRFEGFGLVIAEALALGTPVVSTDCPSGPAEILEGGRYGLLVPVEDAAALAAAIARVLTDSNLADDLHKAGPRRAADFSAAALIPRFEDVLSKVAIP